MQNTQLAQEYSRHYWDYYEDNLQATKSVEPPVIFWVQKGRLDLSMSVCGVNDHVLGTIIPENLILFCNDTCVYSLQPSYGMTLHGMFHSTSSIYIYRESYRFDYNGHIFRGALDSTACPTAATTARLSRRLRG